MPGMIGPIIVEAIVHDVRKTLFNLIRVILKVLTELFPVTPKTIQIIWKTFWSKVFVQLQGTKGERHVSTR